MTMTKKHFILAATEYGRILKSYDEEMHSEKIIAFWHSVDIFSSVAKAVNYNFSKSLFVNWILEIQEGTRDSNGRKTDLIIMK